MCVLVIRLSDCSSLHFKFLFCLCHIVLHERNIYIFLPLWYLISPFIAIVTVSIMFIIFAIVHFDQGIVMLLCVQ